MSVYRTELTPLLLLERSMRVHATAHRRGLRPAPLHLCGAGHARAPARRRRSRRTGLAARRPRRRARAERARACSRRTSACALAGGVLVAINTRLNAAEVRLHPRALRRAHAAGRRRAGAAAGRRCRRASSASSTIEDPEFAPGVPHAFDGPEYEEFLDVAPDDRRFRVADEDELYSINYTSGTTGPPEGRHVHASRRLPERAGGDRLPPRSTRDSVFLWTLPMFHCNGWCFPWAVTGGGRHATCCCARSTRRWSGG